MKSIPSFVFGMSILKQSSHANIIERLKFNFLIHWHPVFSLTSPSPWIHLWKHASIPLSFSFSYLHLSRTYSFSCHTQTHAHTHLYTHYLSPTNTYTHIQPFTFSLSLSLTHTNTHSVSLSLSLSHTHTSSHTLSLSISLLHTHYLSLSFTKTHNLSLSLFHFLHPWDLFEPSSSSAFQLNCQSWNWDEDVNLKKWNVFLHQLQFLLKYEMCKDFPAPKQCFYRYLKILL